ncbi:MAG: ATP-binding protein [Gemmatimonadota bacterium]
MRHPRLLWAVLLWLLVPTAYWILRPLTRRRHWMAFIVLSCLAIATSYHHWRLDTVDHRWPQLRESLVSGAFHSLAGELKAAQRITEDLVAAASRASKVSQDEAFENLAASLPDNVGEVGVVIFDAGDVPYVWAGQFRIVPRALGDSLQVRANRFYLVLETRKHLENGRIAVASLLLWAAPVVPDRARSLASRFHQKTGVDLIVYPPGGAPAGVEVFDYEQPTTAGVRVLFSAQPLPPEQGASKTEALRQAGSWITGLLLLFIVLALLVEPRPWSRILILCALFWVYLRSPAGEFLGLASWFSSATFYRSLLGPFSSSAGILALTSALVTLGAITLWRKRLPLRWYSVVTGIALLIVAPYAMRELGRGITPPSNGVSPGLWLTWQITLLLATAAPIVMAAALFRGDRPVSRTPGSIWIGAAIAVIATIAGVYVWGPQIGWPPWYTFLWTPALFLVTRPAPRWGAIAGIAIVAGCAAGLITWGAVLEGRLNVARKDVGGLGSEPDPLALRQLELFGQQVQLGPSPTTASELFALWRGSNLGLEDYPTQLALWSTAGEPLVELRLDSLDVSQALVSALVRNMDSTQVRQSVQLARTPGVHSLLLQRTSPGMVLSAAIGPRSRLMVPDRLGRLLHRQPLDAPLYSLTLSLPTPGAKLDSLRLHWRREGWRVRGERQLALQDGVRHVHAIVDLRGPIPIFVRGVLVVLLDLGLMMLLWVAVEGLAGQHFRQWSWQRLRRSYQARLAVTLGIFFIVPAAGFAGWGFGRLRAEDDRTRDLVITQTLRDAVLSAGSIPQESIDRTTDGLLQLSRRIDAELGLFSGGALRGSSSPLLVELGVIPSLLPPDAFQSLALADELELTANGPFDQPPTRIGYRVVRPGPSSVIGILASPQPAFDPEVGEEQTDLVLVLLLATLIGAAGALAGAQAASRALSRPVADLRAAALALGEGKLVTPPAQAPPVEFEQVFGAFGRMAADIRSSQAALEDARRRTAAVLATVATGVIALDQEGRVLIANQRAEEILHIAVREGERVSEQLTPEWQPLAESVAHALAHPQDQAGSLEVDAGGRRIRLQLARLGSGVNGVVVALNDFTDVSRAERVLAWGDMARQVAHEIKNPLTPVRLGMQHLLRVYRDRQPDFAATLDETATRILAEIDRLDTIARAFSRFGAPAESAAALERVDMTGTAAEVVQLYQLAESGAAVVLRADGPVWSVARRDEVKEVLVNLLENARNAGAHQIEVVVSAGSIVVEDDGGGMPADQVEHIFEPRFSATTSGSGLGLPIVRRLVESWGASVSVTSEVGKGTRVSIVLTDAVPR